MSITITSNSDAKQSVTAKAEAVAQPAKETEKKSAAASEMPVAETADNSDESELDEVADESEESETEESEESEGEEELEAQPEDEERKPQSGVKKRIDKLRGRVSERDREIAQLRAELAAAKGRGPAEDQGKVETPKTAAADRKPDPEKFETVADYFEALSDWKLEQKLAAEKAEVAKAKAIETQAQIEKAHQERVQSFMKEQPDYKDVVQDALDEIGDVQFTPAFQDLVMRSENGPAIFFELAKDPAKLLRMNSLSYGELNREIGRLEARLEKPEAKTEIKKTNAPKPIAPVKVAGSAAPRKSINDPTLSQAEYEAIRRRQMKASARA